MIRSDQYTFYVTKKSRRKPDVGFDLEPSKLGCNPCIGGRHTLAW